jgi:lipopolysaccharide transport system permease protein
MAALTTKYRDLIQLSGLLVQLWMYATPIIYPLNAVPEKWRWMVELNPVTAPVEAFRLMLLGAGTLTPTSAVVSVAVTTIMLLTGIAVFSKAERTFVDVV